MATLRIDPWTDSAAENAALIEADAVAQKIALDFATDRSSHPLAPDVTVQRDIGGDDRPLYVFQLDVDLRDDLASDDYPMAEIQELASSLRAKIAPTEVDRWSWLVSVATKGSAERQ